MVFGIGKKLLIKIEYMLIRSQELWSCLHRSDRMIGSEGEKRRKQVFKLLSDATEDKEL